MTKKQLLKALEAHLVRLNRERDILTQLRAEVVRLEGEASEAAHCLNRALAALRRYNNGDK